MPIYSDKGSFVAKAVTFCHGVQLVIFLGCFVTAGAVLGLDTFCAKLWVCTAADSCLLFVYNA